MKRLTFLMIFFFIFIYLLFFSFKVEAAVLGQVDVVGQAKVSMNGGSWTKINRVYPVNSGARFTTSEGRLSFIFKDGTSLDVSDNSEIVVSGSVANYSFELKNGKMIFSVPERSNFKIKTPDAFVEVARKTIHMVSTNGDYTVGAVTYDGSKTYVGTFTGEMSIKTLNGEDIKTLEAGNTVSVSSGGDKIITAQAVSDSPIGSSSSVSGSSNDSSSIRGSSNDSLMYAALGVGLLALGVGTYAAFEASDKEDDDDASDAHKRLTLQVNDLQRETNDQERRILRMDKTIGRLEDALQAASPSLL